jgi:hypothetical protein
LNGSWMDVKDKTHEKFTFMYKPKSDSSGYIRPLKKKELHPAFFHIYNHQTGYLIEFTAFMPLSNRQYWKIKKISNLEFVLESDNEITTYSKAPEK